MRCPPSGIKPKETCLEPIPKSPEEDNKAGELDKAQEILCVVLPADEDPTLRPASTTPSVVHSSFAAVAAMVGNTPFALGGGSVSAAAEQLHPHLDPQRTQGALRVTRKLPSAPDIRAGEGRTPCRRNVGDVTLQLRDYPRGHQGGAHEPSHCIVGRGRCLDCYFNCRRSCAWLRTRHVLQRATLRAAGRRRLSSTPPSLR